MKGEKPSVRKPGVLSEGPVVGSSLGLVFIWRLEASSTSVERRVCATSGDAET